MVRRLLSDIWRKSISKGTEEQVQRPTYEAVLNVFGKWGGSQCAWSCLIVLGDMVSEIEGA